MIPLFLLLVSLAWATSPADFSDWAARQNYPHPHPKVAENYRFTGAFFAQIANAAADKPGRVNIEIIGYSHNRRPIWAFHTRDPARPPEHDVLIFAGIHALEWIGTEVATDILLELIEHPVPGVGVTVIPLVNPDGRAKVERDLINGKNIYRRGNQKNVDLNRDYEIHRDVTSAWKVVIPKYYGTSPGPLSQPESVALDTLLDRERYDRSVSLHAFGGFLFYPWAGRFYRPEDAREFAELGHVMARAQGGNAYKTRQLGRYLFVFRAQGSEVDHIYGKYGTKAFLIELTRSGITGNPKTWRTYFRWYNPKKSKRHREKGLAAVRALSRHPFGFQKNTKAVSVIAD